nr:transposase family protein [Bradyrhizobium sp. CCBAU 11386]
MARPKSAVSLCPCCGGQTGRVHSHYERRLADLPWQGRVVEIRLQARRFRCANPQCPRRIFTERLPATVRPQPIAASDRRRGWIEKAGNGLVQQLFSSRGEPA